MDQHTLTPRFDADTIRQRVAELGAEITERYHDLPLSVIVVSNGALFFAADLLREVRLALHVDMISVGSYSGTESTGSVREFSQLKLDVRDRHVLILDDILDSGLTLTYIARKVVPLGPVDVSTCVLLSKRRPRDCALTPDFVGFEMEDEFVVGYGLDYDEHYRNLPHIAVLQPRDKA